MELFILRHGIAEDAEASGVKRDSDRALTREGQEKTRRVAQGMKALDITFDLILTSPYLRAKETADIVVEVLGGKVETTSALIPSESYDKLIAELNGKYRGRKSILLVGHEPHLSGFISLLVAGHPNLSLNMKKAGLCKMTVDSLQESRCAALEWLVPPKILSQLGC